MDSTDKRQLRWESLPSSIQYYIPAVIVVVAVSILSIYADHQRQWQYRESLRANLSEKLGLIRAKLEGDINGNIHLVQGLVATVETEPNIDQERFSALARRIFDTPSQLRNIAAAPDMVIKLIYPIEGNRATVGLDYRKSVAQRDAAMRVAETGRFVVTGPVKLLQGGDGLIVRYPIVNETGHGGRTFWGILSAVIDLNRVYRDSGLLAADLPFNVSIIDLAAEGTQSTQIYGDPSIALGQAVRMTIDFGQAKWQIAAVPKGGWTQLPPDMWIFRLQMMIIGVMIMAPVLFVARLLRERHSNIAVLRQREEELRAISHRLEIALEASKIGVWELDVSTGQLNWDARMKTLYGMDQAQENCSYVDWQKALHPDDLEEEERTFRTAIESGRDYVTQFRIVDAAGEERHVRAYGTMYRDARLRRKMVGVNWNITTDVKLQHALRDAKLQAEIQNRELEQAKQRMEFNSLHDALTGLPNRRYLDQYLSDFSNATGRERPLTLLHIDLDRFKEINDTLGHGAGDQILKHTAVKLKESIRKGDFPARIGGDEFVVVCAGVTSEQEYTDIANRLINAVNTPITYAGHECRVGASIGIASCTNAATQSEQLLVNADIALYEAKRHGRNRVEHYTETLKSITLNTKRTADEILRSLDNDDFVAYFQPQFDAHTLEITGVEALARWRHPEKGILAPISFLKVAESLNVVAQIDVAILRQTLLQSARWTANGLQIPKVSVNISAQRLFDENLSAELETLSLPPGFLSFELLESISFDEKDDSVSASIERIKSFGIDIEIDDFGTGYASILSLLKLSPRRLKIDRQLTMPILNSEPQRRLIGSIVDIGRSLGIEIIAEGVETFEHANILRDLGCQTLQGFALARPMSSSEFLDFSRERAWFPKQAAMAG
ncbi:MAG: bifunctional diguanylate cyclase/phosphodiesterase [Allorhizobium sp.]